MSDRIDNDVPRLTSKWYTAKWFWVVVSIWLSLNLTVAWKSGWLKSAETDEAFAVNAAKAILTQAMANPSSVRIISSRVRLHETSFYMVQLLADAQNSFGAIVRGNFCVVVELPPKAPGTYIYNMKSGVQECSNPPNSAEIEWIKSETNWGQAADPTKLKLNDALH